MSEALLGGSRPSLLLLFGAVGLLLLIACANVGNLLFARGVASRQEFAVRFALGASRRELGRLVVTQSCTLALAGGLLGVLFAYWTFDALKSFVPPQLPRAADVGIDIRVLGFAFFLSLISGTTLALFPAWHLSRGGMWSTLYTHDRATLPAQRVRLVVLAGQVALAMVLLSGAALFVQSFVRLLGTDLGFAPRNVLTLQLTTLQSRYSTLEQQRAFLSEALDRMGTVSGVASVGAVELLPVTRARRGGAVVAVGNGEPEPVDAEPRVVSEGYFEAMGIEVLLGRPLSRQDGSGARHVALVNETLAQRLWPGANPVGQRIRYETEDPREVVGVVRDVRGYAVDTRPDPQIYILYSQTWLVPQRLVIRTNGAPEALRAGGSARTPPARPSGGGREHPAALGPRRGIDCTAAVSGMAARHFRGLRAIAGDGRDSRRRRVRRVPAHPRDRDTNRAGSGQARRHPSRSGAVSRSRGRRLDGGTRGCGRVGPAGPGTSVRGRSPQSADAGRRCRRARGRGSRGCVPAGTTRDAHRSASGPASGMRQAATSAIAHARDWPNPSTKRAVWPRIRRNTPMRAVAKLYDCRQSARSR